MDSDTLKGHRSITRVSDVAKAAGVSVATVSRCFNTPGIVSPELRDKVLEVARTLGYTPNAAAKALRLQRTHIIGAVVPTLDYAIYARMLNAFQEQLAAAGYLVFILTAGFDNSKVPDKMRLLMERGAEAILVVGRIDAPDVDRMLAERNIPVVSTYSYHPDSPFPSIGFDNYKAAYQITEYMIQLGHRHLALLTGPQRNNDRQLDRIRAFQDCLAAHDHPQGGLVLECNYSLTDGANAVRRIQFEHPEVTCILCSSDVLAFGVMSECERLGIRIPEDLSVTGFDDQEFAARLNPPLTTIAVPAAEMGQRAAQAILRCLRTEKPITPTALETSLVIRSSTAAPLRR